MKKPRVLVLVDWYKPYFNAGGPVRSLVNLIDHLGTRIDFHILTGDRDYMAVENEARVVTDKWTALSSGEQVRYTSPQGRSREVWKRLLTQETWDVIYLNGLYSWWSCILPLWLLRGSHQRRVVAVRGMLAAGPMRQGWLKKRVFLAIMRACGCFRNVEFQATNAEEVEDIHRWIGRGTKVHLVRNLGRKMEQQPVREINKRTGELHLVSLGRIAEEKNTLYAIERLLKLSGEVHFDLFGAVYDEAYWERCRSAIERAPANVRVQWHGPLPQERGADELARRHVVFMPSVGENFGHAMLEALVAGRPLLISDRTPWRDLTAVRAGWDLPLEQPERFDAVLQDLVNMDQEQYDQWMAGAKALGARSLNDQDPVTNSYALFTA